MSDVSKRINKFFKTAVRSEVMQLREEVCLTEQEKRVFDMFYIEHKNIGFIADITGYSVTKINNDLKDLREKIVKIL